MYNFKFFLAFIFISFLTAGVHRIADSMEFIKEVSELFSKRNPPLPFSKNSCGPLGQLLETIKVLQKAASIKLAPGSSQSEVRIKILLLLKYLNILSTEPCNVIFFQVYIPLFFSAN